VYFSWEQKKDKISPPPRVSIGRCHDLAWLEARCPPSCSLTPVLSWTRERKPNERLVGQDKDREITRQLPSWATQTQIAEINLLLIKAK